jgi:hypothetical protein
MIGIVRVKLHRIHTAEQASIWNRGNRQMNQATGNGQDRPTKNRAALKALGLDENLAAGFRGDLIGRDDTDLYDRNRQQANPAFDAKPLLIAQCADENDVRIALEISRIGNIRATCRSGGHSTAGYAVLDGGLVIDMRRMNKVEVSPDLKTATIQAGASFADINPTLDPHAVHIPGGACLSVCVGGYMQGGGYGFTSRLLGMNSDNVRSFRMMLADGRIAHASPYENNDLFWAVRGGTGNNFGVLLDVEYIATTTANLVGSVFVWDIDRLADVMFALQKDFMAGDSAPMLGYQLCSAAESGKTTLRMGALCYSDHATDLKARIDRLLKATGGREDPIGWQTYGTLNTQFGNRMQPDRPPGTKEDKQSCYIGKMLTLPDWQDIERYLANPAAPLNFVVIEPYGGRIAEIPSSDSAFVHRSPHMDFIVDVFWQAESEKSAALAWLDGFMALMAPHFDGNVYQNYPRGTFTDYPLKYWGIDTYTELCSIKKKYDPGDFFTFPQAIGNWPDFKPSAGIGSAKLTEAIGKPIVAV